MTWEFWLDKPLHIVVILIVGFIINLVLRSVIRRIMDKIASGVSISKTESSGSQRRKVSEETEQSRARRVQRAQTVGSVLRSVTTIVVAVIVALMVLAELGFNLAPVLASAGIVGVALGFGAQTLVKDFLAGLFIVLEDQYGIGDYVELTDAGGVDVGGMVENVGLRATRCAAPTVPSGISATAKFSNAATCRKAGRGRSWTSPCPTTRISTAPAS